MSITLRAEPMSKQGFAPYGEVIESSRLEAAAMNEARFERFDNLCNVDLTGDANVAVSIARCRTPTSLPLRLEMVERHPLGSQAFIPLSPCTMYVVVAPPGESVDANDLRAFVTNGRQGFNYRLGTWHMPLISTQQGQEFLVIDRAGQESNCEVHMLDEGVVLDVPGA